MEWYIGARTRCDLVSYSGVNLTGVRAVVQVFPTGSRRGQLRTDQLKSLVILAPVGTRVVLAAWPHREGWEDHPWRCVRMVKGSMFRNEAGNEGVRLPDLDWMDPVGARKASDGTQVGYPLVARLADGTGHTFGRGGGLKDAVRAIWIEREDDPIAR
jgi:hypothetical protein